MGRDGITVDTSRVCPVSRAKRIRFTWEAVEGSDPVANRQRKIGQSGAVPTAVDAKGPDSTAGEGFGRPRRLGPNLSLTDTKRTCQACKPGLEPRVSQMQTRCR